LAQGDHYIAEVEGGGCYFDFNLARLQLGARVGDFGIVEGVEETRLLDA